MFEEAATTLKNLGFTLRDARQAVEFVRPHVGATPNVERLIRAALKHLTQPT